MRETIAISKFKATCLRLLDDVKKTGNSLIVTRRGEPIALIMPPPPPAQSDRWLGSMKGELTLAGDVVAPVLGETNWEALGE